MKFSNAKNSTMISKTNCYHTGTVKFRSCREEKVNESPGMLGDSRAFTNNLRQVEDSGDM